MPTSLSPTDVTFWLIPIPDTSYLATNASVIAEAHTAKRYVKGDGEIWTIPNLTFIPTGIEIVGKLQ